MKRIKYITEASFSFALIIAANSMAEWHPFVPNAESGLPHLLMELISPLTYCLTWILCMFIGFFAPASAKGPVAFGALGLIYANMAIVLFRQCGFEIPIEANVAGTIANNIGAPLLYLLWEQYFASEDDDQCIADILVGRGLPVLLFALLGLISSSSQTMGLRAVILLVAAVALTRCYRSMDWSAPMYAERPLDHRRTYLNVMVLSWKSALCIGSLAFLYTVLRSAFTSSNSTLNGILTYAPLLGMLAASLAIMALWQRRSFSFNVIQVFRSLFPFLLCLFAAIPLFATALPQITYGIANLFSSGIHRNGAVLPNVQERWSKSFVYVWILFRHCQRYTASRLWLQLDTEDLCLLRTIAWVRHRSIGHVRHVTRFLFSTGRSRFEDDSIHECRVYRP